MNQLPTIAGRVPEIVQTTLRNECGESYKTFYIRSRDPRWQMLKSGRWGYGYAPRNDLYAYFPTEADARKFIDAVAGREGATTIQYEVIKSFDHLGWWMLRGTPPIDAYWPTRAAAQAFIDADPLTVTLTPEVAKAERVLVKHEGRAMDGEAGKSAWTCRDCGNNLLFSCREMGTGYCHPCAHKRYAATDLWKTKGPTMTTTNEAGAYRRSWECPHCGGYDAGGLELHCSGCGRRADPPTPTLAEPGAKAGCEGTTCPLCNGEKEIVGMFPVYADDVPPDKREPFIVIDCPKCKGAGEITQEHAERIEAGKLLRAKRRSLGWGMREAAVAIGGDICDVPYAEQGDRSLAEIERVSAAYDKLTRKD